MSLPLAAQQRETKRTDAPSVAHRVPRRVLFAAIGAVVGGLASAAYFTGNDNASPGTCTSTTCVGIMSIGGGTLIGYLVGREFDQLHALRYRGGAPLSPPSVAAGLTGAPSVLAARDSLVAVGGVGGVEVFAGSGSGIRKLARRATGVRGISALDVAPGSGVLALGSSAGFYLYPPRTGPGLLVREGAASAVAATSEHVYFAVGTRVESVPPGADTMRTWPGLDVGHSINALAYDSARALLWVGADSMLVALRPAGDSLERVSVLPLGALVRRVNLQGTRIAIALGEGGVKVVDASDAAAPKETGKWTGARFAYDVSFAGSRLYVASGVEGLYVLDVSGAEPRTLGLARDLGFVIALASHDGYTFLLDRTTDSLRRIESDF
jgi:hypothetical protein